MTIFAASLAGALSQFCSCGVIPLIAAMLASGVPLAPVMAFCVSSPIMDPEMFILTAAGISLNFAVDKTIAASGMGLMAGFTVLGLQRAGFIYNPLKITTGNVRKFPHCQFWHTSCSCPYQHPQKLLPAVSFSAFTERIKQVEAFCRTSCPFEATAIH